MYLQKSIALLTFTFFVAPQAQAQTMIVQPGDTLSRIAARQLGNERRWTELCRLNRAVVEDCDVLLPGTTIQLPADTAAAAEVAATPAQPPAAAAEPAPTGAEVPMDKAANEPAAGHTAETPSVARVNLVDLPNDYADAYWSGYFTKPAIASGQPDPVGGSGAARLASADAAGSPQDAYSGVYRQQVVPPGTYTVGAWVRSMSGPLKLRFGLADPYLAPGQVNVGDDWQYVQYTVTTDGEANRLFEVFEATPKNPDWELFGVSVERGTLTTPFYPAPN